MSEDNNRNSLIACAKHAMENSYSPYSKFRVGAALQHIVAHETGVAETIDPLAGSYYVETLTKQIEQLAGRVRRSRFQGDMSDERWRQAVDEHGHILDRLRARDGTGLADALRRHVDTKFETVKEGLDSG